MENTHNNFVVNAFVAVVTKGQQGRNVFANSFNPDLGESAQSYGAMNKGECHMPICYEGQELQQCFFIWNESKLRSHCYNSSGAVVAKFSWGEGG